VLWYGHAEEWQALQQPVSSSTLPRKQRRGSSRASNSYCWIFHFSEETGKVTKIYEYLNTHLVYEVLRDNSA